MKNKIIITLLISITILLSGCCLSHDFSEASCTAPSTCSKCGETQGDILEHTWVEATCTTARTCSVCNLTDGTPLEHQWVDATTENPKTCSLCGLTDGEPLPVETEEPAEVLTGEEISLDLDEEEKELSEEEIPEGLRYTNTEISELAGTTSKHGYVYPDDYIQGGPKDEDAIADIEMMFDKGYITEEEYQELLDLWNKPREERIQESTGGSTINNTQPASVGDTVTVTVQPAPTYEFDGHYCY